MLAQSRVHEEALLGQLTDNYSGSKKPELGARIVGSVIIKFELVHIFHILLISISSFSCKNFNSKNSMYVFSYCYVPSKHIVLIYDDKSPLTIVNKTRHAEHFLLHSNWFHILLDLYVGQNHSLWRVGVSPEGQVHFCTKHKDKSDLEAWKYLFSPFTTFSLLNSNDR